jgi:hypothetical protein
VVGSDGVTGLLERRAQRLEVVDPEGWMRLASGTKILFHPEVQGDIPVREPTAAACRKQSRLGLLSEPQDPFVEGSGLRLPPGWHGELDVVDP